MPLGAIARKLRREAEARAAAAAVGPEPMLTVRLDETPATADLSEITAEAYPVVEVTKPRKPKVKKVKEEDNQ